MPLSHTAADVAAADSSEERVDEHVRGLSPVRNAR
jgi:hypothetical protein